MGGGLILFGIGGGGALPGGLVDAIQQGGSGDSGNDRFVTQEEQASSKARANPTAANWAAVARARFNLANTGDNVDQSTGNYTDAGAEQLRAAGRAWDESVKLAGKKPPDSRVASLMVQAYARPGRPREGDRRAGDRRERPRLRRRVRDAGHARLPGEQPAPRRPGQGQGARPHRAGHARVAARPARIGPRAGGRRPPARRRPTPTPTPARSSRAATIRHRALVAQLAEQRTLNPKVPGSIPGGGTLHETALRRGFVVPGTIAGCP